MNMKKFLIVIDNYIVETIMVESKVDAEKQANEDYGPNFGIVVYEVVM